MESLLPIEPEALTAFCQKHHIRRLSVFGSVLKGTAGPNSDIDLLVDFDAGHIPGLLALASMELELSKMLGGRKVDLRTANDLSRPTLPNVVERVRKGTRFTVIYRSRPAFQIVPIDESGHAPVSLADDSLYRAQAVGSSTDGRTVADHDAVIYGR